jgi:serine/threonine protein kinase
MNIFMHHNDLVLGDLGLARDSKSIVKTSKTTGMGTICYMAPEIVLESKDYNEKIDIWY